MAHGQVDITRVAINGDISRLRIVWNAIQWRVALDQAAMLLGRQQRIHVFEGMNPKFIPRRHIQWLDVNITPAEKQQAALGLGPGGAAARRRANENIVVPAPERRAVVQCSG